MIKHITGVQYEDDKIVGVTVDGLNDGGKDSAYFKRLVYGKWKKVEGYDPESRVYCSECCMRFDYVDGLCFICSDRRLPRYCPNCGAMMENGD